MRFLISPAKTLDLTKNPAWEDREPHYYKQSLPIKNDILKLTKNQMSKQFKIKSNLLEKTYSGFHDASKKGHALMSYNGLVFKNLEIKSLEKPSLTYLKDHVLILDALYGVLRPNDLIEFYRLDFNVKLNKNLYDYWNIQSFIENDTIINLASKEYEKMLDGLSYINIDFKEDIDGTYKNKATYAKMARGKFLRICAMKQVTKLSELKSIAFDGYQFNPLISDISHYIYTRKSG